MDFVAIDEPQITIPEDAVLRVQLEELKKETVNYVDKKTGQPDSFEKLTWWYRVLGPEDYKNRKIKAECRPELSNHPANRFRVLAEALLGFSIQAGTRISTDDLVGLQCDATVLHREWTTKEGEKRISEEVSQVFPVDLSASASNDVPF